MSDCECLTWGRDEKTAKLFLAHHPHCKQYDPETQIRRLLLELIEGIEVWGSDDDGIHPNCWEPYKAACAAVGQWGRVQNEVEGGWQ